MISPLKDIVVFPVGVCNLRTFDVFRKLVACSGVKILITGQLRIESTCSTEERAFRPKMVVSCLSHSLIYFNRFVNILRGTMCP